MPHRKRHRERPNKARRTPRIAQALVIAIAFIALTGCMAMDLSSRGAPEEEMREFELRLEPLDLPAARGGSHHGGPQPAPLWTTIPVSGWLHGFEYSLFDAGGDSVPREVLHHFKVMAPDRRELFSPLMLRLAGAGQETGPVSLPRRIGYPLEKGDSILVTAVLHNPTGQDLEGVQLEIRLQYSPPGSWQSPLPVVPFFTHVTPPLEETSYDLPPGFSHRSIEVRPAISGRILGLGAHLHRYGISVRLEDPIEGRVLWERRAKQSADGTVLEIPHDVFVWSRGPRVESDRTDRVTAIYDNPTGDMIPDGGMGTLGGVIVLEEPWPHVDRQAAEHVWDLNREAGSAPPPEHEHMNGTANLTQPAEHQHR